MNQAWTLCQNPAWLLWAAGRADIKENDKSWEKLAVAIKPLFPHFLPPHWSSFPSEEDRNEALNLNLISKDEWLSARLAWKSPRAWIAKNLANSSTDSSKDQAFTIKQFIPKPWND